jgi:hypothetical protein
LSTVIFLINTLNNGIFMLVKDLFEDSWSGPNNAWHNQGQGDEWYDGNDQWHGQNSGDMTEDFAVANMVTNEADMSDIVTAHGLIAQALRDPVARHEYFKFLKHLRNHHSADYSASVHREAAKLTKAK